RPLLKRVDTGRSTVQAANHSPVHDVTMGTLENGPGDWGQPAQVKNERIPSSHYLSASQEKRATGLRNDRRVGVGCGRLIASSVQIVCAAWRHSLASYLPTRSSQIGSRLERRRKHWAMARDFKHRSSGARMDFDSGFGSLPCKSCRPFEQGPLSWPLIGVVISCMLAGLHPRDKSCRRASRSSPWISNSRFRSRCHDEVVITGLLVDERSGSEAKPIDEADI